MEAVAMHIKELSKGLDFEVLNGYQSQEEKRRAEWLREKRGKFSASEFHRLMGYFDRDELPKGGETYATEKAIELLTHESEEGYTNGDMDRGSNLETESMSRFMEDTGLEVTHYGKDQEFVKLGNDVGCTPDGLIGSETGVEGKAPTSKVHLFYLNNVKTAEDLKKHKPEYYAQCQGSLYVTGRKLWYWFSYDPRFNKHEHQMIIVPIERDQQYIDKLKDRLFKAIAFRNNLLKQLG